MDGPPIQHPGEAGREIHDNRDATSVLYKD